MRRLIKKRTIFLIAFCIILGLFLGYRLFVGPKKEKATWVVPNINNVSKKFSLEEALVNEIRQKQDLITLEVDMTEKVILDNSWGDLSIFKKVQTVNFFGKGIYTVDLSKLQSEKVSVENKSNKITVKVSGPTIKAIDLDNQKTTYQDPDNGFFRFGEIKLTPAESDTMQATVKEKMVKKLSEDEYTEKAKKSTEEIITKLVQNIMNSETNTKYAVVVDFE